MNKIILLAMMSTSCTYLLFGQSSSVLLGSRANSMGYASACLDDEWSVFNNVAGLAKVKEMSAGFSCDVFPGFKPFNRAAGVIVFPYKIASGIGIYHFGDDLYREEMVSAAAATSIGLTSLGLKINYIQYNVMGMGRKGLFTVSIGGMSEIVPGITIGAHITTVNQPFISRKDEERIPTRLLTGIQFRLTNSVRIAAEIEKDLSYAATVKAGVEYKHNEMFLVRTGVNIHPSAGFFGLGFRRKKLLLDYAFSYYVESGARHQGTVSYRFKPRK